MDTTLDLDGIPLPDPAKLLNHDWEEGKLIPVALGAYGRHANFVICNPVGWKEGNFHNGTYRYSTTNAIVGGDNKIRPRGAHIIFRFPNADLIVIVERRHALYHLPRRSNILTFTDGRTIDLGPTGSVEFPGGSVEPGEKLHIGMTREALEETGLTGIAEATILRRIDGTALLVSEFLNETHCAVADIPETGKHPDWVANDGGLRVLRISQSDFRTNMCRGVIPAGSALDMWAFLQETQNPQLLDEMIRYGRVVRETVTFKA